MEIIYLDSLFFLNFIIDYLLLLACGRICSLPLRRGRMALAAAAGGLYAALAVLLPGLFNTLPAKILSGGALVLLAFGLGRCFLRRVLVFFAVAAAFGGAVYAACSLGGQSGFGRLYIPVSLKVLVLSFALCYAALTLVFSNSGRRAGRRLHRVRITLGQRQAELTALRDTGNELTDPVSGAGVLVAEAAALSPLFPPGTEPLLRADPASAFAELSQLPELRGRLRLLPCRCVTGGESMLLCFTPDELRLDEMKRRATVAVSPHALSPDGAYQSLI